RVYLMLHDKDRFNADEMKAWVLRDWQSPEGGKVLGTQSSMLAHLEALFSGGRVVQSPLVQNEGLVKRARAFLDGTTSSERLYERAKTAMLEEAPPDFTLLRVVGAQAGTVFSRASGEPLEKGVPGLYTYDGYHELFSKRLPELLAKAQDEDAWVMGQASPNSLWGAAGSVPQALGNAQKKTLDVASRLLKLEPLMEDIRRRYLTEYTAHWIAFLDDIRPVTGSTLAFDLTVLRQFAAPDSPLSRLARAAIRETTLSRQINIIPEDEKSYFDKASEQFARQTTAVKKNLGLRPEARLEKQLVDSRFAALREVVTGQSEAAFYGAGSSSSGNAFSGGLRSSLNNGVNNTVNATLNGSGGGSGYAGAGRPALENVSAMLNEFYTVLAVAETALSSNSMPPTSADPGAKLPLEGNRLPAPFREVMLGLAGSGAEKITQGASDILRGQATQQMDRLLGLMSAQVTDACKRGIEGRYPFVPASAAGTAPEVQIEDFNAVFASGGVADEYFSKYLAPFVDTGLRPWRYKSPGTANLMTPVESLGNAATPATTGPTLTGELLKLLAQKGPNPDAFAQVAQIRDVFFREAGAKRMAWKMDLKVLELDPSINELVINLDGQGQRYVHGPVQAIPINWPGPRGGAQAELTATPRIRPDTSSIVTSGPWALLRLMERGRVIDSATVGRASVEFTFDGRRAVLDINTGRLANPMTTDLLRNFKCPGTA
ncbi:MAG: icmF, partial [Rhodoferax sp.]|nr:icmF [Rhodoferax sp.]